MEVSFVTVVEGKSSPEEEGFQKHDGIVEPQLVV
jgi:hypothetical protein